MAFTNISKKNGLKNIKQLIKKFSSNYSYYAKSSSSYNETQARKDFIDPFFESLNWDLQNKKNLPNYAREVILEDSIESESTHQNPDYGFQAGTSKKFFVEAKKPSVKIENNKKTGFQARSYGWTGNHPIVILTNFEYLIIYDSTVKPNDTDDSKICRIKVYNYKDYVSKFDEIYDLLSRESIFSGNFDKKVSKLITKKPTVSPDAFFLEQINRWRIKLGENLYTYDSTLTEEEINDLVQKFINRIIFLRICEDRTLEKHGTLLKTAQYKDHKKFLDLLKAADKKYDSDLFHLAGRGLQVIIDSTHPDVLEIIEELYYPKSPFSYRIIQSSILGDEYEMFLTEKIVIKKVGKKSFKITLEKKPDEKNRDIISTPSFIIRKIVEEVVGKKSQGRNPEELFKLKIIDPACGSGSFLVEALQLLINYLIEWYVKKNNMSKVYEVTGGWRLKLNEKIKLLSCLNGVDIDFNAVEVTKFALCIKLMEHETNKTIGKMKQIIPKLNNNILCGNSIVDENIWKVIKKSKLKRTEIEKINSFDWNSEFPNMKKNKFDVVIGNPPYRKTEDMKKLTPNQLKFFKKYYTDIAYKQFDKYYIFIGKGLELLGVGGKLGYIVPHKFMKIESGRKLRNLISKNNFVEKIIDFGTQQLFKNRTTYTCLLFLKKVN